MIEGGGDYRDMVITDLADSQLVADIALWCSNVVDLDIVVDDRRRALDDAVDDLRQAVRERERALIHLARLHAMLTDVAVCP